jgi:hypothetical protein
MATEIQRKIRRHVYVPKRNKSGQGTCAHEPIHGVREMDDDGDLWRLDLTGLEGNS